MAERPQTQPMPPKSRFARLLRVLDRFAPPVMLVAFLIVAVRELLPPPRPKKPKAQIAAPIPQLPGTVRLSIPTAVSPALTRISLYRGGDYAESAPGVPLRDLRAELLTEMPLPPGVYVAMVRYRGETVGGDAFQVQPGQDTAFELPLKEMAAVEYRAGLEAANGDIARRADIARFQRTVKLDPSHVNARLQLAADALARGDRKGAHSQLATVRKLEPKNRHAQRIARLLGGGRSS